MSRGANNVIEIPFALRILLFNLRLERQIDIPAAISSSE
jgi:hypothetical protein